MSYLIFDRMLLANLGRSLDKEMLRTNQAGSYSSTTVVDCNTRKYHGLLVVPIPGLDNENHVLLSTCDETVVQHGAEFNVGIHKYGPDYFSPRGHKYIREFSFNAVATTTYRIGGVILRKERLLVSGESRILVRYTLVDAHSTTILRLRPFLAFRNVNELTHRNDNANTACRTVENGVSFCMYNNYPDLIMQTNKKCEWVECPDWYMGVEYPKEQERGYEFKEDLFVPGYFEMSIKKGESVVFSAGTSPISPRTLKRVFETELEHRIIRKDFRSCLHNAAEQFYNDFDGGHYITAGYPWFGNRARDQFIALPGVTLAVGNDAYFHKVMQCAYGVITEFLNTYTLSDKLEEIDAPDVLLWYIWDIQQYAKFAGLDKAAALYSGQVLEILNFIRRQKHPNLFMHENGLLYSNGHDVPVSWMNATENGRPVVPRSGYIVEINAMWYNVLKFASQLFLIQEKESYADLLSYQSEITGKSFVDTFWNGHYLYDYVDGDYYDNEVRPNMLFAVSLPFTPLDRSRQKAVVDTATKELLTVRGLRSLSPKSGMYRPFYQGSIIERNRNYHNGTVWPWLTAAMVEAYLRVYGNSGVSFVYRMIMGLEPELKELTLGTLSELYDGNPPFRGHGAMSYAMTVGEILRAYDIVVRYAQDMKK